jgi:osomolarity two-component system response regulator SKN7
MNAGSKYDLVLMDIIMPNLDGVSACHLIRQFDNTPIIAMTSNIRSDDISMYFQHGRLPASHVPELFSDFARHE